MTEWSGHDPRLTPRQREILERIARGHTNTQIATDLGIGFETVKMHVSHILRELGVSSREEAAAWWRETHRPLTRIRAVLAVGFAARTWAIAGAVAAGTAGLAVLAVAIALASARGSDAGPPPAAAAQATETVTATLTPVPTAVTATASATGTVEAPPTPPTPPPPGMGYEPAAALLDFALVSVEGDALHTRVVVEVSGNGHDLWDLIRETGYPVFWLTDSTGQRQQLHGGGDLSNGRWVYEAPTIAETPGTLFIEAQPVREYVVPAVPAGAPDPVWARWEVPWTGYTSTTRSVALPAPNRAAFGDGSVVVDEVLQSDTRTRIRWHLEGFASEQETPAPYWLYQVFDPTTGEPLPTAGGGTHDGGVLGGIVEFSPTGGDVVLLIRGGTTYRHGIIECENVESVANGGLVCKDPPPPPGWNTLPELRKHSGPVAEFLIDLR